MVEAPEAGATGRAAAGAAAGTAAAGAAAGGAAAGAATGVAAGATAAAMRDVIVLCPECRSASDRRAAVDGAEAVWGRRPVSMDWLIESVVAYQLQPIELYRL